MVKPVINLNQMNKKYNILELQKMSIIDLTSVAETAQITIQNNFKQSLIYAILDKQNDSEKPTSELHARDRDAVADSMLEYK